MQLDDAANLSGPSSFRIYRHGSAHTVVQKSLLRNAERSRPDGLFQGRRVAPAAARWREKIILGLFLHGSCDAQEDQNENNQQWGSGSHASRIPNTDRVPTAQAVDSLIARFEGLVFAKRSIPRFGVTERGKKIY